MLRFLLTPTTLTWLKRGVFALAVLCLLSLGGLAFFISSLDLGAIEREVLARIERESGAKLSFAQSRRVYWPQPRVVIEAARFDAPNLKLSFTAPRLVLAFDVLDLLDGQVEAATLTLHDASILLDRALLDEPARSPRNMTQTLAALTNLFEERSGFDRLRITLANARISFLGSGGGEEHFVLTPLEARLRYSRHTGRIDVFARRYADIRPLELTFSLPTKPLLTKAAGAPASIAASGYGSRMSLNGRIRIDPDLSFSGDMSGVLHPALAVALGMVEGTPRFDGRDVTNLSATFSLDPRGIGLEALRIAQSGKTLSGIAAFRENAGRWSLSSTLAGDLVDGSAAQLTLSRLREGDGSWSRKPLDLNPAPQLDLDIRLSTKAFRLGGIDLHDAALSIFTRPGRAEFSIAEGGFGQGTIKARVAILQKSDENELRLLISGEKLEAGSFLERAFGFSRITGKGSFILQAESRGVDIGDYVENLSGSSAFDIREGEIIGIDLERLAARSAIQPPQAALFAAIGGKTPFESLNTSFTILNGKVEPSGSRFVSANVESQLDGMIDLAAARHELAIILKRRRAVAGSESEFFAFRIEGPLLAPLLRPDMALLPNRL